jgi:hypothetical protein
MTKGASAPPRLLSPSNLQRRPAKPNNTAEGGCGRMPAAQISPRTPLPLLLGE